MKTEAFYVERIRELEDENVLLAKKLKVVQANIKHVEAESWKGKDSPTINSFNGYYIFTEHRKDKFTNEVKDINHKIQNETVKKIYDIIKKHVNYRCDIAGYKFDNAHAPLIFDVGARDLWIELIDEYKIRVELDAFNGGQNRNKYYFPLYYYPLKILESKGVIEYEGYGRIRLLETNYKIYSGNN
jgi:hypothetical protein